MAIDKIAHGRPLDLHPITAENTKYIHDNTSKNVKKEMKKQKIKTRDENERPKWTGFFKFFF